MMTQCEYGTISETMRFLRSRNMKTLYEHNAEKEEAERPKDTPAGVTCPKCGKELMVPPYDSGCYGMYGRAVFCPDDACGFTGIKRVSP